jgi:hypothetical protein
MNDTLHMQFLCGYQGEALLKIEPHLVPEAAFRACACAVGLVNALIQNVL